MYTIYVNDCPLTLASTAEAPQHDFVLRYPGSPKFFLQVCGTLEGGKHPEGIVVTCADVEQAWADFRTHHKWVPAAGGAVRNGDALLCIYRRDRWDLPKGKIDAGESEAEAALREVTEETGINSLEIGEQLPTTYHTYSTKKGKRILKPTYWYLMRTSQCELIPEEDEDIEKAVWVLPAQANLILAGMYPSLRGIAAAGFDAAF